MAEVPSLETIGSILKEHERRLGAMERSNTLRNASMREGTLTITDPDGLARVTMGSLDDGEYGMVVADQDGYPVFRVKGEGMDLPYIPVHSFNANNSVACNDAEFTDTQFWAQAETVSHPGLYVWVAVYCEVGVTGEVRISESYNGATTSAVSFTTEGSTDIVQFRWLHGIPITLGPVVFKVQARRTAGVGNFFVYEPNGIALTAGGLCTPTGV